MNNKCTDPAQLDPQVSIHVAPGPFSLSDIPTLSERRWLQKIVYRLFGLDKLDQLYQKLPNTDSAQGFLQALITQQDIKHRVSRTSDQNLANKPLLVVANHPCGIVEGLLLLNFMLGNRSDVKLLANKFLRRVPELSEVLLGVLPFSDKLAITKNQQPIRHAANWLAEGHCMICFPAGNVSRLQSSTLTVVDDVWSSQVVRLARASNVDILPVYFGGRNSLLFSLLSLLGENMHSFLYAREFLNKQGEHILMRVGEVIPSRDLDRFSPEEATKLLRSKVYALA